MARMVLPASAPAIASLRVVDDNIVQRIQVVALCREPGVNMIYEAGSGAEALWNCRRSWYCRPNC